VEFGAWSFERRLVWYGMEWSWSEIPSCCFRFTALCSCSYYIAVLLGGGGVLAFSHQTFWRWRPRSFSFWKTWSVILLRSNITQYDDYRHPLPWPYGNLLPSYFRILSPDTAGLFVLILPLVSGCHDLSPDKSARPGPKIICILDQQLLPRKPFSCHSFAKEPITPRPDISALAIQPTSHLCMQIYKQFPESKSRTLNANPSASVIECTGENLPILADVNVKVP